MNDTTKIVIGIVAGVVTAVVAQAVIKAVGLKAQQTQYQPQTYDYDHMVIRW